MAKAPQADIYAKWARWFLSERSGRTVAPESAVTTAQYIQRRLAQKPNFIYGTGSLRLYEEVLSIDPNNALVLTAQAERLAPLEFVLQQPTNNIVAAERGSYSDAELWSQLAIRSNPQEPRAILARGLILALTGRLAEAEVIVQRALEIDPTETDAWNLRGRIYEARGAMEEAQQAYTKAIESIGTRTNLNPQVRVALLTRRAEVRKGLGRQAEAQADLLAAKQIEERIRAQESSEQEESNKRVFALVCHSKLLQIDVAKKEWALDKDKEDGTEVLESDFRAYLLGGKMPVCPAGGAYKLNKIGEKPTCSVPGHLLDK
jgi:tetratricopeptide (TPR) repeat protein